jgi:hypothetical protein
LGAVLRIAVCFVTLEAIVAVHIVLGVRYSRRGTEGVLERLCPFTCPLVSLLNYGTGLDNILYLGGGDVLTKSCWANPYVLIYDL